MSEENKPRWMSIKEASRELRETEYKIRQLVKDGSVCVKENKRDKREKLVDINEIRRFLEAD